MYQTTDGQTFDDYQLAVLHQQGINKAEHEQERRELWRLEAKELELQDEEEDN